MPQEVKTYLGKGFAVIARLSEDKLAAMVEVAKDYMAFPSSARRSEVASRFGITREDAMAMTTAISFMTFFLTSRAGTAEDFMRGLMATNVVDKAQQPSVLRVAQAIDNSRAALREISERYRIANALLPSLTRFESTIDLRLGFEKSELGFAVPVALMHVDTDAEGEELWFQVTQRQLEALIKDLEEARRRMDQAEKWSKSRFAQE
jgi:hypothetical protein